MTEWKNAARTQQIRWKRATPTLPAEAREDGLYFKSCRRGEQVIRKEIGPYPYCLPRRFATHNLLDGVRRTALERFHRYGIAWHEGTPGADLKGDIGPTTHLLSSQVQCINSLLSLELQPDLLLERLQTIEPSTRKLVPIRHASHPAPEGFAAFEWIGQENYLGERVRGKRVRGAMVTSADALIVVECSDGRYTGVLIEWKFTENYAGRIPYKRSVKGKDRREIYGPHYEAASSSFVAGRPPIDAYFHGLHYQLLRQSLLAHSMVQAGEHGIDRMIVLYLAPAANQALREGVPAALKPYGPTVDAVWRALLPGPKVRFMWQDTQPWVTATPELAERYAVLFDPSLNCHTA